MAKEKLKEFHFSLGNSTDGPIGFCATLRAESAKDAVALLKKALPAEMEVHPCVDGEEKARITYIEVYFNEDKITETDIDEEYDAENPVDKAND